MFIKNHDVDRKISAILQILSNSRQSVGATVIARSLSGLGIELSERAVRYHLRLMDEQGLTRLVGRRDGRVITETGTKELQKALVADKVGFAFSRIATLAFNTTFNATDRTGLVPVNISLFPKADFPKALHIMKRIFRAGLCVSNLVAMATEGETIGDTPVPAGKVALATVCSIVVNGALLKAGIPVDSRFGGTLQIQDNKPRRFTELIHYSGSSLDPSEIFIRARMTSVLQVAESGNGEILASFREIPAVCLPMAEEVVSELKSAGIGGLFLMGNVSEPVCETPVDLNRVGAILIGGLNPVAATQEAGIESENHAMSALLDYRQLVKIDDIKLKQEKLYE
jgi:HTH-type transcriptional regulator, global nitrogen regulator NrpRI